MLINPTTLSILRAAAIPVIVAVIVGSCTANHYKTKIKNMELTWEVQLAEQKIKAEQIVAKQKELSREVESEYKDKIESINSKYAGAIDRLRNAQAKRVSSVPKSTEGSDGKTEGDRLPEGDRVCADPVKLAEIAQAADENTQKLISLQEWIETVAKP